MKTLIITVIFAILVALASSKWIRGWSSQLRHEQADAIVHHLAHSSRRHSTDQSFTPGDDAA